MKIRIAELIEGTEQPVGEGITAPIKAALRVEGQIVSGIVKSISIEKITAECLCAVLLRHWGAPVPEPVIVKGDPLKFASLDIGYPNLKQKIGYTDLLSKTEQEALIKIGRKLISQFASTPLVIAADEAIGNTDRNIGNILWDGESVAYIDHERCLGLSNDPDINKLAALVTQSENITQIQTSAIAIALTLTTDIMHSIDSANVDVNIFSEYLRGRITGLPSKVLSRFPEPKDLLTGLN